MAEVSEYTGSLQEFEIDSTLWLVVALPLLASLVAALARALPPGDPRRERLRDSRLMVGAMFGSLGFLLMSAVELFSLPAPRRFLLSPLASMARLGSLDLGLAFALDPLSAACALAVALLGVAVALRTPRRAAEGASLPAVSLAVGAAQLLVLADNFALTLIGWHLLALAGWSMLAGSPTGPSRALRSLAGLGRFGDVAVSAGAALLFWGLGGGWSSSGYTPDYQPRLLAVTSTPAVPVESSLSAATGTLTVAALPGARVRAGSAEVCAIDADGRLGGLGYTARPCREPARTPFRRLPMPAGRLDLRVDAGPGAGVLLVDKLLVPRGGHVAVAVAGPSLTYRELADQLRVKDATGGAPLAGALGARRLGGVPLIALALALIALGALTRAAQYPFGAWLERAADAASPDAALAAGALGTLGGVYLLARLAFYLPLTPDLAGSLALAGALTILIAGARSLQSSEPKRVLVRVAAAQAGLCIVAVSSGAVAVVALGLMVHSLALGAWLLTEEGVDGSEPRAALARRLATLALAGAPWPLVGVFWVRDGALAAVSGEAVGGFVPGALVAALTLVGSALVSFSMWRLCYLSNRGASMKRTLAPGERSPPRALALAALACALGLLGMTDAALGGASHPAPIDTLFGAAPLDGGLDDGVRVAVLALSFGAPLFAWSAARRRYAPGARAGEDAAARALARPERPVTEPWLAMASFAGLGRLMSATGALLVALDQWIDVFLGAPARWLAARAVIDAGRAEPNPPTGASRRDGSSEGGER
ncbi:MAG: proton-conducting transporter membrane subunit [Sorangiineae bacterium]|nr:proton-conducting transporter membrane subunit [Polyangiaceae bacterium]MEB2322267.1 proton-conducting transporter membrane subunit [Sorangiineae bacterium]